MFGCGHALAGFCLAKFAHEEGEWDKDEGKRCINLEKGEKVGKVGWYDHCGGRYVFYACKKLNIESVDAVI